MSKPTTESKELVQYIIQHYPEYMESKSLRGHTPLALAYSLHRVEFAELLINGGANQTTRDNKGNNLVHLMLCNLSDRVLEEPDNVTKLLDLLDKRLVYSMFTERSSDGPGSLTPLARWLHHTITTGLYYHYNSSGNRNTETQNRVEIVRTLLSFAEPTGQKHLEILDGTGNTPVHDVVKGQLPRIFELMIDARPDLLHRENSTGTTPFELAVDAWVAEATEHPPFLPTKNDTSYWDYRLDRESLINRPPQSFVQSPPKSERKMICDMARARVGASPSQKRKLVSLNEANEVAKRLAVQSETRGRALRCMQEIEDEGLLRPDEVMLWYGEACQF